MKESKPNQSYLDFYITPEHECPYLPNQQSKTVFLNPEIEPQVNIYQWLIERGFRRSGEHIYRPQCEQCNACISIRISPKTFKPNKQQRRCAKKGNRFITKVSSANFDQEHYNLFESYINTRHRDGDMYPTSEKQYRDFVLSNWANSQFLDFIDPLTSSLIACCVFDRLDNGLSAIYTFFDVNYSKFSLGRLAILKLLKLCDSEHLNYVYLGYWISQCQKMAYKGEYRPLECFVEDKWVYLK